MSFFKVTILIFLLFISSLVNSQTLDATFGSKGQIILPHFLGKDSEEDGGGIAMQTDGKIVIAGTYQDSGNYLSVVRLNSDGTHDNSFDGDGIVITSIINNGTGHVAIQTDGKILLVGISSDYSIKIVRLNTNGSVDNSLDTSKTAISGNYIRDFSGIWLQPDGKILILYSSRDLNDYDILMLTRLNTDGSIDNTFDGDGTLSLSNGTDFYYRPHNLRLQSDGKIVLSATIGDFSNPNLAIIRLNNDGSFDNSFSNDGIANNLYSGFGKALAIQPDGKIIVAGESSSSATATIPIGINMVRVLSNGSIDSSFGVNGRTYEYLNQKLLYTLDMFIQSDGRIYVTGYNMDNYLGPITSLHFAISRFSSNGNFENNYEIPGFYPDPSDDENTGMVVLPNQKILMVGTTQPNSSIIPPDYSWYIALAQLTVPLFPPQPSSIIGSTKVCKENYIYTVNADPGITYQWTLSGGGTITANNNSANVNWTTSGGPYTITVTPTNSAGNGTPRSILVNMPAFSITGASGNINICPSSTVFRSVQATGIGLKYQWQLYDGATYINIADGSAYLNTNLPNLSISGPALISGNSYKYRCQVMDSCSNILYSNPAIVTLDQPTLVNLSASDLNNKTICSGQSTTFSIVATGTGLNYQWQQSSDGTNFSDLANSGSYSNTTTATLNINNAIAATSYYRCKISSNTCGTTTTASATLVVIPTPVINSQPSNTSSCAGDTVSFTITSTGNELYQWQEDHGSGFIDLINTPPYFNVNTNTLTINGVSTAMSTFKYRCVISHLSCSLNSNQVSVNVFSPISGVPTLSTPLNGSFNISSTPTLSWNILPNAISYDLQVATDINFINIIKLINGVTTANCSISSPLADNTQYFWRVKANSICGNTNYSTIFSFRTQRFVCNTYNSTNVPIAIPSTTTGQVSSYINIPQGAKISNVRVKNLKGTHSNIGDLTVALQSPSNKLVYLFSAQCNNTQDFFANFDDASTQALICPPVGDLTFHPIQSLSANINDNSAGYWYLGILDSYVNNGGSLNGWSLEICTYNEAPAIIRNSTLTLNAGTSKTISSSSLTATDFDNTSSEIIFTIDSLPSFGKLTLNNSQLSKGSTFTQSDINAGLLSYTNDSINKNSDIFRFSISDGSGGNITNLFFHISISHPSGIANVIQTTSIQVAPNPVEDILKITFSDLISDYIDIYVTTELGISVQKINLKNTNNNFEYLLDMSNYPSGIYFISLKSNQFFYVKKIIKI